MTSLPTALLAPPVRNRARRILPGFGLSLGVSMTLLSLIVLIPLAGLALKTATLSPSQFWKTVTSEFVVAAYKLSFGGAAVAAVINSVFGLLVAWVLVRYPFPGRRIVDALIDVPFALPTAVAGLTFANLYGPTGWFGSNLFGRSIVNFFGWILNSLSIGDGDRSVGGVVIPLVFIGLPFVVRTVQPVLQDLERDIEEAASSLGASPWTTFRRVIFPEILPAWLTGLGLAFGRAVGEYGSLIFIIGNIPGRSQIAPQLIIEQLGIIDEQHDSQATAIALVLLTMSFAVLASLNALQWWVRRKEAR